MNNDGQEQRYNTFLKTKAQERRHRRRVVKKMIGIGMCGALFGTLIHWLFFTCGNEACSAIIGFLIALICLEGGVVTAKECKKDANKNFLITFFKSKLMVFLTSFAIGGWGCQIWLHHEGIFFPIFNGCIILFFFMAHRIYQNNHYHQGFYPCDL